MRYPNLTAEYENNRHNGFDLRSLADAANVTKPIMLDILYGNEDVSFSEAIALYRIYDWYTVPHGGLNNYSMEYMFAPVLATLDPQKPKTRCRFQLLREPLERADTLNPAPTGYYDVILRKAKRVYNCMRRGERVTYSEYRGAIFGLDAFAAVYRPRQTPRGRSLKETETA